MDEVEHYDRDFYAGHKKGPTGAAYRLGAALWKLYRPEYTVDVGCAVGVLLKGLMDAADEDLDRPSVWGVDSPRYRDAILGAGPEIPVERYVWLDLEDPQDRRKLGGFVRANLAVCTEVAEHLPAECAEGLVEAVTAFADRVVWSAAVPGQGGDHHINEQPPEYWEAMFRSHGFEWDREDTRTLREALGPTGDEPWYGAVRVYRRRRVPSTTILVRTFNDADVVSQAFGSIRALEHNGPITVRVGVDMGSTDGTPEKVDELVSDGPGGSLRLSWAVERLPHTTPLGAFRILAGRCGNEGHVLILDADNRLHPDRLSRMDAICPNPEGVCACAIRRLHPDGTPDGIPIIPLPGASFTYDHMTRNGGQLDGLCLRINAKYLKDRILPILDEIGDADLPEDQIITLVAAYDGLLHVHPDEVLADYTVRPEALSMRRGVGAVSARTIERVRGILERSEVSTIPGTVLRRPEGFRTHVLHLHYDPEKHPDRDANPPEVARARQKPTWDFIHAHRKELSEAGITIEDVKVGPSRRWGGDLDRAIRSRWWNTADVLGVWEPDVVPVSVDQVLWVMSGEWEWAGARMRINRCHQMHLSSDDPAEPVTSDGAMEAYVCYAHQFEHDAFRVLINGNPLAGRWAQPDEEWADLAPLGLTAFRRDMRYRVGANWAPVDWNMTDTSISNFLSSHGYRCRRVGSYVAHNHIAREDHEAVVFDDGRRIPIVTLDRLHPEARRHVLSLPKVRSVYEAAGIPIPEDER
jgi:hypothetical protein